MLYYNFFYFSSFSLSPVGHLHPPHAAPSATWPWPWRWCSFSLDPPLLAPAMAGTPSLHPSAMVAARKLINMVIVAMVSQCHLPAVACPIASRPWQISGAASWISSQPWRCLAPHRGSHGGWCQAGVPKSTPRSSSPWQHQCGSRSAVDGSLDGVAAMTHNV